jgi:catechol 2,3-dioxygenase-like lactoylglutathione lyase family enzyme
MMGGSVQYRGGNNVAMKLPPHHFERAVTFYRDTLGLTVEDRGESKLVEFGPIRLWLDRCPHFSQTELWLEVVTSNSDAAARHLGERQVVRCDPIEKLPEGFRGFWIASPADIVHIVSEGAQ